MKRMRWLVLGGVLGVAGYVWASRKVRDAVPSARRELARSAGERARTMGERARELGARVREAVAEGREAMAGREEELRRELLRS